MLKNKLTHFLKELPKRKLPVLCLFAVIVIFTACQDVTGPAGDAAADLFGLNAAKSKVDPNQIVITDEDGLRAIEDDPTEDYVLGASFPVSNWTPICGPYTSIDPFTGTLDGAGYTITVESFDSTALTGSDYIGIFAVIGNGSASPTVSNITVNIDTDPITTTAQFVGGLAGEVNGATIGGVQITGILNVTSTYTPPSSVREKALNAQNFHAMVATKDGQQTAVYVGGVAGFVLNSTIAAPVTSVSIHATATQAPVFAGGVGGFVEGSSISRGVSSSNVVSNGPGYNTSGGGIAGYIVGAQVSDSSASGNIEVTALGVKFDDYDSWQVDAGGLIGYAGGSETTASTITHSHATGSVTAYAPFPYAGGLAGYLYGYNNFTDPASNGTVVSTSYATGDVTSISQDDPNGKWGDIPYAGGLVGYSSVVGTIIQDSYARGNATAETSGTYAWGGGLIGGNTNDAVVTRSYATGDVQVETGSLPPIYAPYHAEQDPGPAAGGIAGYNYYTKATTVSNSVALNTIVHGNQTKQDVVHRVVGSQANNTGYPGTLTDNLANVNMIIGDNWVQHIGASDLDGANTVVRPAQSVYQGLGWSFGSTQAAPWSMGADGYPALY
jgi:hypothetical protein